MDAELKVIFGKILGEVYRIQLHMKPNICRVGEATVYGLLNGIESAIDDEIDLDPEFLVTRQESDLMDRVLAEADQDPKFAGFYDIEPKLAGIDRGKAIRLLTYINASGCFTEVIAKMNSQDSPAECKKLDLDSEDI
jgi:hypothetical protein